MNKIKMSNKSEGEQTGVYVEENNNKVMLPLMSQGVVVRSVVLCCDNDRCVQKGKSLISLLCAKNFAVVCWWVD